MFFFHSCVVVNCGFCFQYDRHLVWSVRQRGAENEKWILLEAYAYLKNPSNLVRHFAANLMHKVFKYGAPAMTHVVHSPSGAHPWSPTKDGSHIIQFDRRAELFGNLYKLIVNESFHVPVSTPCMKLP